MSFPHAPTAKIPNECDDRINVFSVTRFLFITKRTFGMVFVGSMPTHNFHPQKISFYLLQVKINSTDVAWLRSIKLAFLDNFKENLFQIFH